MFPAFLKPEVRAVRCLKRQLVAATGGRMGAEGLGGRCQGSLEEMGLDRL